MKIKIVWLVVTIIIAAGGAAIWKYNATPGELDSFAQCLEDRGAVFYGAFWCPHCVKQKKLFGKSARLLPYVECSTADGQGQLPECKNKDIQGYPTWEFADGSRVSGEMALKALADKTQCPLNTGADAR